MKKRLLIILCSVLLAVSAGAQGYKYEFGGSLGMTGYLGDVNKSNLWKHPHLTGGVLGRYIYNSRWAFKANLNYAMLKGDSEGMALPYGNQISFFSKVVDLGLTAEFNFLNFGYGPRYKKYKPITPYMVLGVGFEMAFCGNGNNAASFVIPMGIGVKYKIKERLNVGFEFTMRKEFSDKIDNITDLNLSEHGFAKNTDWYSFAMFTVTYEFGKRCVKCHYIE